MLHDEQQTGGAVGGDNTVFDAGVDLPSCLSNVLRYSIAVCCPSFAAFVHHARANSFDCATPKP